MRWMPINRAVAARANGFVRYVQYRDTYRDHHPDDIDDVDGLIRYVKHRDQTAHGGRLFDGDGSAGDVERQAFVESIERAARASLDSGGPHSSTDDRAYYQIIISPADARGLDLRALTRAAMRQLAADAGTGGLPPWVAGEHRNTKHPHVHVVLAAKRELDDGRYRTLLITNPRRARMHEAINLEMARQREARTNRQQVALRATEAARPTPLQTDQRPVQRPTQHDLETTAAYSAHGSRMDRVALLVRNRPLTRLAHVAGRLAGQYLRDAEREARRRQAEIEEEERRMRYSR